MAKKTNFTDEQKAEIEMAYNLGKAGFYNGKNAAAQDAELLKMVPTTKAGTLNIIKSWSKGWHDTHWNETNKAVEKARIFN